MTDWETDRALEARLDARTNTRAIIALLTALLGLVLPAIVFGIIGMLQCGRRDEEGWGMAFAAILISLVVILGAFAIVLTSVASS